MGASPLQREQDSAGKSAQAGNLAELRQIYEAHACVVTRRLAQVTGDAELARDLAQDTFVVAFDRIASFRGEACLSTWLHAIAFNLLRDHRKRTRRRRSLWSRLGLQSPATVEPEGQLESREELGRLQAILAALDDTQRDAFVLRVVEGLSLAEAAEILDVRVATVSYRARRAEAIVREAFEKAKSS